MSASSLVICDAGPLIALGKLNRLHLLADLYSEVQIPHAVYSEVVTQGLRRGSPDAETVRRFWQYQNWPVVRISSQQIADYHPPVTLGTGEIEVLMLAQSAASELSSSMTK